MRLYTFGSAAYLSSTRASASAAKKSLDTSQRSSQHTWEQELYVIPAQLSWCLICCMKHSTVALTFPSQASSLSFSLPSLASTILYLCQLSTWGSGLSFSAHIAPPPCMAPVHPRWLRYLCAEATAALILPDLREPSDGEKNCPSRAFELVNCSLTPEWRLRQWAA